MRIPKAVLVVAMLVLGVSLPELAEPLLLAAAAVTIISAPPLGPTEERCARRQTTWSLRLERDHQRTSGSPPAEVVPPAGNEQDDPAHPQ